MFSAFSVIRPLITHQDYVDDIKKGLLKFCYVGEWEAQLAEELADLRSPFLFCRSIIMSSTHPLYPVIGKFVSKNAKRT